MGKVRFLGVAAMVALIFGVVFLTNIPQFLKYTKGDIKNFEELEQNELNIGDLVQGTIDFTDGSFAEMEETNTTFGIETSKRTTKQYYAIYMYNEKYVAYETGNAEQIAQLEKLADECQKYYEGIESAYNENKDEPDLLDTDTDDDTEEFEGTVKELPSDLDGFFREWYGEGYDEDVEKVLITRADFGRMRYLIYFGIGAAVLGIILLIVTVIVWRKEKTETSFSY
ncbi:MAG TPA: hypothetical protein DCP68_04585 [Ruminococcus sp.]|nr:hypothetical protein [Ruminococcus sp.]